MYGMGFNNPAMPWRELERRLSDSSHSGVRGIYASNNAPPERFVRPEKGQRTRAVVPYAELHTHSHFSFLDGASSPEELVLEAVRLDLNALALTDHGGFWKHLEANLSRLGGFRKQFEGADAGPAFICGRFFRVFSISRAIMDS